jgi:hypothetical protein
VIFREHSDESQYYLKWGVFLQRKWAINFQEKCDRELIHSHCFIWAIILSGFRGSVTNDNGFWIGWLDLLTPSFAISLNHNQL